ncbi:hypothetical protein BSKO_04372 [Bryopsis sp. KO-2023]|nr:hypothetical protein BSKO_04372 [Bryopsis sp. KO-2023]
MQIASCSSRCPRPPGYTARIRCSSKPHVKVAARVPRCQGSVPGLDAKLDDELSMRPLDLDESGYFIIRLDREAKDIVAEHYTNTINKNGIACDPDTGKPIPCTAGYKRAPSNVFRGRTAKELSVLIVEKEDPPLTRLEHANYLGREFQKAEFALLDGSEYVQD